MKRTLALTCFFLSGFAGLVYEICWIRQSALVFGSTTLALSTVLAIYFAGLALGSWRLGRIAVRLRRPLRLYAAFEIALAVVAAATPLLFAMVDGAYGGMVRSFGDRTTLLIGARVLLIAAVLLPPTILMGATLPLFCRQFVDRRARIAGRVGFLYGLNTLGAAFGAAAAGFWLMPRLGLHGSIMLAAALDLIVGLVAWSLRVEAPAPAPAPAQGAAAEPASAAAIDRRRAALVAGLFFVTGLVALGGEVLWSRFLALIVRNTVLTYTITLSVVLAGIVLGSWIAGRIFDRDLPRADWFAALQAAGALSMMVLMLLPPSVWRGMSEGLWPYLVLMLLPATLSGMLYPLAMRMVLDDPRVAAAGVGRMTALNTFGGICGSLIAGFALLPVVGMSAALRILTGLGIAGAAVAWIGVARGRRGPRVAAAVVAAALWLLLPAAMGVRLPADLLAPRDRLVDFAEGATATLAVVRGEQTLNLEIDRHWQGQDEICHQIMAAHVPMLAHPDPKRVLVVGVGVGQTAARFLMYDIDALDCVDIEPAIYPFVQRHFDSEWMDDPRVRLLDDDGRSFVAHARGAYDLVSVEVGQVFRPGVDAFYTREFYEQARDRLAPGGLLSQFVPLPFLGEAEFRSVLRTFLEVFPESYLWYNTAELLLVGVNGPRAWFPVDRLQLLNREGPVRDDLRFSHWGGPEQWQMRPVPLLGGFLCGPKGLAELARGGDVYDDDRPVLAYGTRGAMIGQQREIPLARLIARHLDPVNDLLDRPVDARSAQAIAEFRDRNLADIAASCLLRDAATSQHATPPAQLARRLREAVALNPGSALGHRMLGWAEVRRGDVEAAETSYRTALGIRPDDRTARRELAAVLIEKGVFAEAASLLRGLLRAHPDDARLRNSLGVALAGAGDLAGAERAFAEAVRLAPDDLDARRNLERARRDRGR